MTKILGIDPALVKLGWGIIESNHPKINYVNSGTIITKNDTALHLRLAYITIELEKIIDLYKPNQIAMEETFVNLNALSSLKLAYVRGAIMSLVGRHNLKYQEFLPNKIKKTLVGSGHADKIQVKHMVKTIISNSPASIGFDESDALAIAYTGSVYNNEE